MVSWSKSFEVPQPSTTQDGLAALASECCRDVQRSCVLQGGKDGSVKRTYEETNAKNRTW
jgi:hypothetical protein